MKLTREILHDRHRLSHQQIDRWLDENSGTRFLDEKLKQLEAVKTFLHITDLLTQNGISFSNLKGPLLSYRIYGDPTVRLSHDIDILIDIDDLEHVVKFLFENGYQLSIGSYWPKKKVQQGMIITTAQHLSFYNKELKFYLEVHWILMHGLPVSIKSQKEVIAGNLTELDFAGRKFTVLNKEFELLFLLIHGARHGWNRLKWLVDIKDYPVKGIDAATFEKLALRLNAGRIIGQASFLMNKFFSKQLPFSGDGQLPPYFINFAQRSIAGEIPELQSPMDIFHYFRYLWLMFPGYYYKYKFVTSNLIRTGDISVADFPSKIMYFIYRPYSFIKRRMLHINRL